MHAQGPGRSEQRSGTIASLMFLSQQKPGMHTQPWHPAPQGNAEETLAVLTVFVIKDHGAACKAQSPCQPYLWAWQQWQGSSAEGSTSCPLD